MSEIRFTKWARETSNWNKYEKGTIIRCVYCGDVIAEETYDKNGENRRFEFFNIITKQLLAWFNRDQMNDIHSIIHFCAENPLNLETDEIVDKQENLCYSKT